MGSSRGSSKDKEELNGGGDIDADLGRLFIKANHPTPSDVTRQLGHM